jgi:hypothetical protein
MRLKAIFNIRLWYTNYAPNITKYLSYVYIILYENRISNIKLNY